MSCESPLIFSEHLNPNDESLELVIIVIYSQG